MALIEVKNKKNGWKTKPETMILPPVSGNSSQVTVLREVNAKGTKGKMLNKGKQIPVNAMFHLLVEFSVNIKWGREEAAFLHDAPVSSRSIFHRCCVVDFVLPDKG